MARDGVDFSKFLKLAKARVPLKIVRAKMLGAGISAAVADAVAAVLEVLGSPVDEKNRYPRPGGHHLRVCKRGGAHYRVHNNVRDVFQRCGANAGVVTKTDTPLLLPVLLAQAVTAGGASYAVMDVILDIPETDAIAWVLLGGVAATAAAGNATTAAPAATAAAQRANASSAADSRFDPFSVLSHAVLQPALVSRVSGPLAGST